MTINKQKHNVYIDFIVSENPKTDESEGYIALAKWFAESLLSFSAYRHHFVGQETDDSVYRIEIDNGTYDVIATYLDIEAFCKNAIEGRA